MAEWHDAAMRKISRLGAEGKEVRELALSSLYFFARLVNPLYMYGDIHKEVYDWLEEYALFGKNFFKSTPKYKGMDFPTSKLIMLPRGHLKSHIVATWCAWMIARHPEVTILYISATSNLAEKQLYAIQNILDGPVFRKYFPEYVCPQKTLRSKWTTDTIIVDHELRQKLGVRDPTIATAGLTTNTTGWHADIIACDDIVVPDNAYSEEGRRSVSKAVAQFSSIRNPGGFTVASGTRYHPRDEYASWKEMKYDVFNDDGELLTCQYVWEIKEYQVEVDGNFLWPRIVASNGKAYGFNLNTLSKIKAEYNKDLVQFYAQYYNNPNAESLNAINQDAFQYYDNKFLKYGEDGWEFKGKKLNIYAAVDFAYSMNKRSDYTAIVVIGIDCDGFIYILDIDRFRSDKISEYYNHIVTLHSKWEFKKIRAEVSVAQKVIVNDLKEEIRKHGRRLSVEEVRPTRKEGSKEERIASILEPRYSELLIWHRKDGLTPVLEEELVQIKPPHDDVKDALASAIEIAIKPQRRQSSDVNRTKPISNSRFGGISFRG